MALFADIPTNAWLAATGLVALGTLFQVASGVGLGLIAGPGFLLLLDAPEAVQLGIALNLLLSCLLLPFERKDVDREWTLQLSLWALLGIPLGLLFVVWAGGTWLRVVGGVLVLLASLQLMAGGAAKIGQHFGVRSCGVMSGAMTGALGMPGPVALWGLLNSPLPARQIRAVLRAYFVVAYGVAFLLYLGINAVGLRLAGLFLALIPAMVISIAIGVVAKQHLPELWLRRGLVLLLLAMGSVLLLDGVRDAIEF